jgi:isoleucyl-tRNA synthetase
VQNAIASADREMLAAKVRANEPIELTSASGSINLDPSDLWMATKAPQGWASAEDRDTQVAIDTRITEELKLEGLAREIVRQVQELRKSAGLQMEDRIVLSLQADAAVLKKAIEEHQEYICRETLAVKLTAESLGKEAHRAEVKIEGQLLVIELKRA